MLFSNIFNVLIENVWLLVKNKNFLFVNNIVFCLCLKYIDIK